MTAPDIDEALVQAAMDVRVAVHERDSLVARALLALHASRAAEAKVVEAAVAWRTGRDRNIVGTAPMGGQRSATGVALVDAVDDLIRLRAGKEGL